MKHFVRALLAAGLALVPRSASADPPPPVAAEARAILQAHCAGCHGGGKASKGRFGFVLDRDRLVGRQLVTPGQPRASDLWLRIEQGEMPPPAQKQRPTPAERKVLERWIEAGAPAFDAPTAPAVALTPHEVAALIRADLQRLEPRRRRFTRYLTLAHLAARSAAERQAVRAAAGKLLNSLSWHPRITPPEPVDPGGTVLRLDLRAYKWDAATWARLAAVYPYRLPAGADSEVAMRADWFVATASRPPLYHDLLQLPGSDRALERLLNVDSAGDIQDDNVMRAGFNDSGVSRNNRLLQRHDAAHGTLWRSYDFANNTGRQNLFEHPIGPNTGATSFQPAGGELIFHLPNGLQGYMLVDARGRRIDKAPGEIVADPRRPDQRVETGISCMSCHARGLLPRVDQLRAHVEKNAAVFGPAVRDAVRATHPRPALLQARIEADNRRYLKALEPFGLCDPDQEPVNLVTQRFEATLDCPAAAAELGLTIAELGPFLKRDPEHARLLGSLLTQGGTVQREVFQARFPELAQRLPAIQAATVEPPAADAFRGHTGTVNAVAFSADGQRAASGSDDRTVRIWTVPGGKQLACLEGSRGEVFALAFSRDGRFLLSGGADRLLRLWDLRTMKQVRVFEGHTAAVRTVAFSPDGRQAVSGGDDRSLRVWDVDRGTEKAVLAGHTGSVAAVAWSADGRRLLSGSHDGTVRWWALAGPKQLVCLEGHAGAVLSVALAPDGRTALSGGNDKTIHAWDLAAGKSLHAFRGHASAVVIVQFLADGRTFLSSGSQYQSGAAAWRRWDLTERKEIGARAAGAEQRFGCAAFAPDGRHVLAGGPGGFLRLWPW